MKKKTETRYVVERRYPGAWLDVSGYHSRIGEARSAERSVKRTYPGVKFRIVRVTTTREVVR